MRIAVGGTVLAQDALVVGDDAAPQSDLRLAEEATVQESKPVGADRRSLFNRKNAGGTLSFAVRPRYATLEAAAAAVLRLAGRRGATGDLKVWAGGVWQNDQTPPTVEPIPGAVVQKVKARQIGVTVEAKYEIAF